MSFKATNVCFLAIFIPVCVTGICLSHLNALPRYSTKSPVRLFTFGSTPANTSKPLKFVSGKFNLLSVENKGFILEAYANEATDNSHATGGVLCDKIYKFHKIVFNINQKSIFGRSGHTVNGLRSPIEGVAVYYDHSKYKSFGQALGKPAGVVQVANPVVVGAFNPFFVPFGSLLQSGKLKEPNSSENFSYPLIFSWFDTLSYNSRYYAYIGSYYGVKENKLFPGVINILPGPIPASLSYTQFKAFGNVRGSNGQPIQTVPNIFPLAGRPVYEDTSGFVLKDTLL